MQMLDAGSGVGADCAIVLSLRRYSHLGLTTLPASMASWIPIPDEAAAYIMSPHTVHLRELSRIASNQEKIISS